MKLEEEEEEEEGRRRSEWALVLQKPWTATENGVSHEGRGRGRGEVDSSQDQ
jgi:hypothetical protein